MNDAHHLHWGAEALWQQLHPLLPGLAVEVVARCESTNTTLIERARRRGGAPDVPVTRPGEFDPMVRADTPHGRRADDLQPVLLVAEQQTRGRGRMGRNWQSSARASLTFSLALPFEPADWSGLSLAVGLALAEALDPSPPEATPRLALKWPNDLMLRDGPGLGRKLGGVLIETLPVGRQRLVVVGIGLNVAPQACVDLGLGYACVQELDPGATAPQVLARVALPLARMLRQFERHGFGPLRLRYAARDLLQGQRVSTSHADGAEGLCEGVDESGSLCLRTGGRVLRVSSGEVSVRSLAGQES